MPEYIARYRTFAARMREIADKCSDAATKQDLLSLVALFERLASYRERTLKSAAPSEYRLCLLDEKGVTTAREEFIAPSDEAAAEICRVVADACSEHHLGYEIWSFARLVSRVPEVSSVSVAVPAWTEIERGRQSNILDLEESIQQSRWAIAQSRRLVEKTNALRTILNGG